MNVLFQFKENRAVPFFLHKKNYYKVKVSDSNSKKSPPKVYKGCQIALDKEGKYIAFFRDEAEKVRLAILSTTRKDPNSPTIAEMVEQAGHHAIDQDWSMSILERKVPIVIALWAPTNKGEVDLQTEFRSSRSPAAHPATGVIPVAIALQLSLDKKDLECWAVIDEQDIEKDILLWACEGDGSGSPETFFESLFTFPTPGEKAPRGAFVNFEWFLSYSTEEKTQLLDSCYEWFQSWYSQLRMGAKFNMSQFVAETKKSWSKGRKNVPPSQVAPSPSPAADLTRPHPTAATLAPKAATLSAAPKAKAAVLTPAASPVVETAVVPAKNGAIPPKGLKGKQLEKWYAKRGGRKQLAKA